VGVTALVDLDLNLLTVVLKLKEIERMPKTADRKEKLHVMKKK